MHYAVKRRPRLQMSKGKHSLAALVVGSPADERQFAQQFKFQDFFLVVGLGFRLLVDS
jgi:hypothetical protein